MTDTPRSAPGDTPAEGGAERFAAQPGQHLNPQPPADDEPGAEHGRHEMPGAAGYPQFEGPGAPQYGSEPVEPPPPVSTSGGAVPPPPPVSGVPVPPPGGAPVPPPSHGGPQYGYGPQDVLPGAAPPPGSVPPHGAVPPQGVQPHGAVPPGAVPPQGTVPSQGAVPPQGTYPPQGGYPPQGTVPPQGWAPTGDTAPPPGYGYTPYGVPPGGPGGLGIGRALGYGWDRFRANPIPWIGITLVGFVAYLAVVLVVNVGHVQSLPALLLLALVVAVVVWLLQAAMLRGALYETDGTPPDLQGFFGFVNAGNVLLTALAVFLVAVVAAALCVVPAIVVLFLGMFSLHFAIDQDLGPFAAIKASVQLVIANAAQLVLLALAVAVLTFLAVLPCGIGLLVAGPVTAIAVTYAYRTLTGGLAA
ncbi:hypothetical protein IU500_01720 [Nocardia terpenica]|uniref:hypothetical protein n=1 Tax=Nocardia terpenica TaxID=455432 RepID=UPI0018931E68|nr:hypothetical protein [Nocardia terpenica]MBF6059707.1 hypothetical protein [Nocardia terpenica]MBF6102752.1 hypothetical protein [Nocardia terpenica]MBF6111057.1 hypothetical protein [Nocardia terpenica]MBF6117188.1 hypothetical protein [Nocardia terpenica]MBF6150971.1 hypothetical protein [Nocardia terpenica]